MSILLICGDVSSWNVLNKMLSGYWGEAWTIPALLKLYEGKRKGFNSRDLVLTRLTSIMFRRIITKFFGCRNCSGGLRLMGEAGEDELCLV